MANVLQINNPQLVGARFYYEAPDIYLWVPWYNNFAFGERSARIGTQYACCARKWLYEALFEYGLWYVNVRENPRARSLVATDQEVWRILASELYTIPLENKERADMNLRFPMMNKKGPIIFQGTSIVPEKLCADIYAHMEGAQISAILSDMTTEQLIARLDIELARTREGLRDPMVCAICARLHFSQHILKCICAHHDTDLIMMYMKYHDDDHTMQEMIAKYGLVDVLQNVEHHLLDGQYHTYLTYIARNAAKYHHFEMLIYCFCTTYVDNYARINEAFISSLTLENDYRELWREFDRIMVQYANRASGLKYEDTERPNPYTHIPIATQRNVPESGVPYPLHELELPEPHTNVVLRDAHMPLCACTYVINPNH